MARLRNGLVAFVAVGGLASLFVLGDDIGAVVFFWAFFGGIAALVTLIGSLGHDIEKVDSDDDEVGFPTKRGLFPDVPKAIADWPESPIPYTDRDGVTKDARTGLPI